VDTITSCCKYLVSDAASSLYECLHNSEQILDSSQMQSHYSCDDSIGSSTQHTALFCDPRQLDQCDAELKDLAQESLNLLRAAIF
jgi:hypothetical protein